MQVTTHLTPDEAVARMVPLLTNGGAKVTSATSTAVTGEVVTKRSPEIVVVVLLLLLMILPGILYLIFGGSTVVDPFSISITSGPEGTTLIAAGRGRGEKAAEYAITSV